VNEPDRIAMTDALVPAAVKNARDAADKARQASDEHRRSRRDSDPPDAAHARKGEELQRLAAEASVKFEVAKQQARGAASLKRREKSIADDAQLQSRLRDEAQARRDASTTSVAPRTRGHR
jgi:hypothetical protein